MPSPLPVAAVEDIVSRFPNRVIDDDGTALSLLTWATGAPMRQKIAAIVSGLSADLVTTAVRALSTMSEVSTGLKPDHGPF